MAGCTSPFLGLDLVDFWRQMEECFRELLQTPGVRGVEIDPERLPEMRLDPQPVSWPDPPEVSEDE